MNVAAMDVFWPMGPGAWAVMPRIMVAVGVLVGLWVLGALAGQVILRLGKARELDPDLTGLLARISQLALLVFGVVTTLGTMGVDVNALVAGLGLTGFALGFALKDIISNTLAGILILLYKPFRRGDHISVAGNEGTVSEIDMRYTVLAAAGGARILVPNATLFTHSITVHRRAEGGTTGGA